MPKSLSAIGVALASVYLESLYLTSRLKGGVKITALKNVKLGEIAGILNGIPDSKQTWPANNSGALIYKYIQPNHLGIFNDIQYVTEIRRQNPLDNSCLIHKNDILFKRLNPDIATLVDEDMLNTTFSSNLIVIRVFKEYYPSYIACLLENQGKVWLNSNITGSVAAIKSISAKSLAELDIPVVQYEKQKAIGELWLLYKKRKMLINNLIAEDQRLMAAALRSVTAGARED